MSWKWNLAIPKGQRPLTTELFWKRERCSLLLLIRVRNQLSIYWGRSDWHNWNGFILRCWEGHLERWCRGIISTIQPIRQNIYGRAAGFAAVSGNEILLSVNEVYPELTATGSHVSQGTALRPGYQYQWFVQITCCDRMIRGLIFALPSAQLIKSHFAFASLQTPYSTCCGSFDSCKKWCGRQEGTPCRDYIVEKMTV